MGEMMGKAKAIICLESLRREKRLNAIALHKLPPGMHNDGNGLYLDVQKSGSRSWILRTVVRGRRKDIGLGSLSTTPLADAREEAARLRGKARRGDDILMIRRMEKRKANVPTFREAATTVHKEVARTLKNEHNQAVWLRSLDKHVFPIFGNKTLDAVESADVLRAIAPIWTNKPDMARKTLARIRRVMDWATIKGYRNVIAGDIVVPRPNPCIGIQVALPKQPKDGNHAALQYKDLPMFIVALNESNSGSLVRLATEFTILTCLRTSEVLEAEWPEFDIDGKVWSISGKRMKMDEPHKVPLSDRCKAILLELKDMTDGRFVFPSPLKKDTPLSNVAMLRALQRMEGFEEITMHGFRATFKTWAHERTKFDRLVIEAALAHKVDGIDRHYLRTTFFEQRAQLMEMWSAYVTGAPAAD
jgi:integrase